MMGIVHRMILTELVRVFLITLAIVTTLFVVGGLIQEALIKGLTPAQVIEAIPLLIPSTLPYTIPACSLFASCLVYNRMSADNEVLALRTVGVDVLHLLWPALAFGLLTGTTLAGLLYAFVPVSQSRLHEHLVRDAEGLLYGRIKRDGVLKLSDLDYELSVREVRGRDLKDVIVKKRNPDGPGYAWVARARSAQVAVQRRGDGAADADSALDPPDSVTPELVIYMTGCMLVTPEGDTSADVGSQEFATPLPEVLGGRHIKWLPSTQTWPELFVYRDEVGQTAADLATKVSEIEARADRAPAEEADALRQMAASTRDRRLASLTRLHRAIRTEMHMRPVFAVSCLGFVLIGCPVGIRAGRSSVLGVFLVCFLPTLAAYYTVLLAGFGLIIGGKLPPATTWAANAVMFLVVAALVPRLIRR